MVTTLSAENCKTKERLIRSRKKVFLEKKYQSLIFGYKIRVISLIHNTLSRMRLL